MMKIYTLIPWHTNITRDNRLEIAFAYQYLVFSDGDKWVFYIPLEERVMVIDLKTREIINTNDVFAFKVTGDTGIVRLTLGELVEGSDIMNALDPIIDREIFMDDKRQRNGNRKKTHVAMAMTQEEMDGIDAKNMRRGAGNMRPIRVSKTTEHTVLEIELANIMHQIDNTLANGKREEFTLWVREMEAAQKRLDDFKAKERKRNMQGNISTTSTDPNYNE